MADEIKRKPFDDVKTFPIPNSHSVSFGPFTKVIQSIKPGKLCLSSFHKTFPTPPQIHYHFSDAPLRFPIAPAGEFNWPIPTRRVSGCFRTANQLIIHLDAFY